MSRSEVRSVAVNRDAVADAVWVLHQDLCDRYRAPWSHDRYVTQRRAVTWHRLARSLGWSNSDLLADRRVQLGFGR